MSGYTLDRAVDLATIDAVEGFKRDMRKYILEYRDIHPKDEYGLEDPLQSSSILHWERKGWPGQMAAICPLCDRNWRQGL